MRSYFGTDTRGVSEVVGAVLLLGILILTLSLYQVAVVPNQNAATEFEHNQQIENEMVDVRNAILEARSSGDETFASVTLGTRYQDRTLTINPPSPTGTLQTVEQRNVTVTERGGDDDPLDLANLTLENQFLEYTPQYSEYGQAGTIRYENTIAYHDYGDANVFLTNQTLLRGDTVSLIPLEGAFRQDGMRRVAVEPTPGLLKTEAVDDPNVTVPTELSNETWNELLEDELDEGDEVTVTNGNLTLSLNGTHDVAYAPVGVNRVPNEGERGSGDDGGINPAAPGDVSLINASYNTNNEEWTLKFRNDGEAATNFTAARINFYFLRSGNKEPTEVNITKGSTSETLVIGNDFESLNPVIEIPNDKETNINIDILDGNPKSNDFFILTLKFESGETGLYFISE